MTSTPDQATALAALRAALTAHGHTVTDTRTEEGDAALLVPLTPECAVIRITGYLPHQPRTGWHATVRADNPHAADCRWLWICCPLERRSLAEDVERIVSVVTEHAAAYRARCQAWRDELAGPTAGQILCEALTAAGHQAAITDQGVFLREVVVVDLPGGPGEIWITDADARTNHRPSQHAGWVAYYRPEGEYTCGPAELIYTRGDRDLTADTARLVQSVTVRAAAYAHAAARAANRTDHA